MNVLADEEQTRPRAARPSPKQLIAAGIFALLAVYLASIVPTTEIAWVSAMLVLTSYLFASEIVEIGRAS